MQRLFLHLYRLRAGSACAIAGHKVPFNRSGFAESHFPAVQQGQVDHGYQR